MAEGAARIETVQYEDVAFMINGKPWQGAVPIEEVLLDTLRERIGLQGTKRSCQSEVCGACTVLVNREPVSSCSYLTFEAVGAAVTTVEGLAENGKPTSLQEAFIRNV